MVGKQFPVSGVVEVFQVEKPWIFVRAPEEYTLRFREQAHRGLVPISVTLGQSCWDTSLMPMGDGTSFIPLNAKVRKAEGVGVGDHIDLVFKLRAKNSL